MSTRTTTTRGAGRRITLLVALMLGAFAVLAIRATWLGAVRSSSLSDKADRQHLITVDLPAPRGSIMSADGRILAVDRPTVLVTADGRYVEDPAKVAAAVSSVSGGTTKDRLRMENELRKKRAYVVLAKHVSVKHAEYLKEQKLAGLHFARTSARTYPSGKTAGQILGLTNLETGDGADGLERSRDDVLGGVDGKRVEVRDLKLGQTVRIAESRDPKPGQDIELTIHAGIQSQLEQHLVSARTTYGAKSAMGVVMDPRTGAVLAMTSVPRANPNDRKNLNPDHLPNRAVTDPYEPGSVFKVVTAAGVLEEGLATPATSWSVPPNRTLARNTPDEFTVEEAKERDHHQKMTTTEIIQLSSNIGTLMLSDLLSRKGKLRPWMAKFAFGEKTGIDVAAENAGNLPKPKWDLGVRYNIPLGQGMTATMIQQVRAYAAIANGGYLVRPHVVSRIGGRSVAPAEKTQILSAATARQLTGILTKVVEGTSGTGVEAHIAEYQVAGKTGTAQKVDPVKGVYVDRYRSSFIGYVPAGNPRLVIAVMLDDPNPDGPHTGGDVAAPVFQDVADFALNALGIPPD